MTSVKVMTYLGCLPVCIWLEDCRFDSSAKLLVIYEEWFEMNAVFRRRMESVAWTLCTSAPQVVTSGVCKRPGRAFHTWWTFADLYLFLCRKGCLTCSDTVVWPPHGGQHRLDSPSDQGHTSSPRKIATGIEPAITYSKSSAVPLRVKLSSLKKTN